MNFIKFYGEIILISGVVLYEYAGAPQSFEEQLAEFRNLKCYWSKSGWMEKDIACHWLNEVHIPNIKSSPLK